MPEETDLFHIIHTTRAMRRLKPDPVPDALIRRILEAGVAAANGSNRQNWRFLIVKDEKIKRQVQIFYQAGVRGSGGAALFHQRAAAGRDARPLHAPARRGGVFDGAFPRSAGVDRGLSR